MRLEPQPARALALLLSRAGEVVTRDELRAAIWGGHTHVDYDRGLAYCASQIRTALGDSGENPRFLQTLPKRGFRFVAPVATEPAANQAPAPPVDSQRPPLPPARGRSGPSWWRGRTAWLTAVAALAVAALIWIRADTPPRQAIVAVTIFDNETGDAAPRRLRHRIERSRGVAPHRARPGPGRRHRQRGGAAPAAGDPQPEGAGRVRCRPTT